MEDGNDVDCGYDKSQNTIQNDKDVNEKFFIKSGISTKYIKHPVSVYEISNIKKRRQ